MSDDAGRAPAQATTKAPRVYALIWLVPIVAAALAVYIGWATLASRGPLITITFDDGTGLIAGQTKVEHKAVAIGTVEGLALSDDFDRVTASVRISSSAAPLITDHARFWVVRPRFSLTEISGLQTLFSGSFIAIDPGPPGGAQARHFEGLSQPPGVRSDVAGRAFELRARSLGGLAIGSPVFYRGITVGQLIDYTGSEPDQPITMRVFVKAPYDRDVRTETHFWNSSGLSVDLGPAGVHVAVESVEALLAGGIAFGNFRAAEHSPPAAPDTVFELYEDFDAAENAGFRENIRCVAYFDEGVSGLERGSAVQLFGIRVGTVTGVGLQLDPTTSRPRVRVTFDVQPGRLSQPVETPGKDPLEMAQQLADLGMRARVDTTNLLTGQQAIGLDMLPDAGPARVAVEDGRILWPSASGGLQDLANSLEAVMAKLERLPLDQLGARADDLLKSLRELSDTAKGDLGTVAAQLPRLAHGFERTLQDADRVLASAREGYGANSQTVRDLQELVTEATATARSLRRLADFLDRHPSSVIWGR
ncbi:MAG TPA: MlaD family protein [Solirubrobacteraceae bacterium]|nr:MlaD family protein [Solirubrobacteraceae bacterium]